MQTSMEIIHIFRKRMFGQRRYQEIIEESPSFVDEKRKNYETLSGLLKYEYFNAGTIEFLMDQKRIIFRE
jgi:acetyl/propionyl-CoA carboxylase alpha subunit